MTSKKHDASSQFWALVAQFKGRDMIKSGDVNSSAPHEVYALRTFSQTLIPGNPIDDAIAIMFAKTGFDVRNPTHWKFLMGLLSIVHCAEWPKVAAPKLWTWARFHKLHEHIEEIQSRHPDFGDQALARALIKSKPYQATYGKYKTTYICERIRDARKWKRDFDSSLQNYLESTRRSYETVGIAWTTELEAERTHSFIDSAHLVFDF
jgi:hypothetical protein